MTLVIVTIKIKGDSYSNDFHFKIKKATGLGIIDSLDYELVTTEIFIEKSELDDKKDLAAKVYILIKNDTIEENTENLIIQIDTNNIGISDVVIKNGFHTIIINNAKREFDSSNPYRIYLGSSFDFFEGLDPNKLYARINVFQPDIAQLGKKGWFKIGIDAGLFQIKSITTDESPVKYNYYEYINEVKDTIRNYQIDRTRNTSVLNTTLYLNPNLLLWKNNIINLYASLYVEYFSRTLSYTYENDTLSSSMSRERLNRSPYVYKVLILIFLHQILMPPPEWI